MVNKSRHEIADMVRRMLSKAESAASTPAEIEAFAAKASKLMLEYNLTASDIQQAHTAANSSARKLEDIYTQTTYQYSHSKKEFDRVWRVKVLRAIANVHFCRVLTYNHTPYCSIVGEPGSVELVTAVYEFVERQISRMATKDYNTTGKRYEHSRTGKRVSLDEWRRSFGYGCADQLSERLRTDRDAYALQTVSTALVVQKDAEVDQAVGIHFPNLTVNKTVALIGVAYSNGFKAADNIHMSK